MLKSSGAYLGQVISARMEQIKNKMKNQGRRNHKDHMLAKHSTGRGGAEEEREVEEVYLRNEAVTGIQTESRFRSACFRLRAAADGSHEVLGFEVDSRVVMRLVRGYAACGTGSVPSGDGGYRRGEWPRSYQP
jgi:hypothetical protein